MKVLIVHHNIAEPKADLKGKGKKQEKKRKKNEGKNRCSVNELDNIRS